MKNRFWQAKRASMKANHALWPRDRQRQRERAPSRSNDDESTSSGDMLRGRRGGGVLAYHSMPSPPALAERLWCSALCGGHLCCCCCWCWNGSEGEAHLAWPPAGGEGVEAVDLTPPSTSCFKLRRLSEDLARKRLNFLWPRRKRVCEAGEASIGLTRPSQTGGGWCRDTPKQAMLHGSVTPQRFEKFLSVK